MRILKLVVFGLLSTVLAGFAQVPSPPPGRPGQAIPDNVEVVPDVEIGKGGDRPLHAEIARPRNPGNAPMAAVLWIHGGGWSAGSYKNNPALFLAAKGYFTASIEYRLSGEAKWPAQIEDCKLAVRWLRANAKKYDVDPDHIGCWGHSAGGHLVACLGTMGDEAEFEGAGGYPGVSSKVQAVVDASGPIDFAFNREKDQGAGPDKSPDILVQLFGGTFAEKPEVWKKASPISHVQAGDPPFLVIHGDQDHSVPYEGAVRFVAALEKAGVPVQFITVKGGGHNMDEPSAQPDKRAVRAEMLAFFDRTLRK